MRIGVPKEFFGEGLAIDVFTQMKEFGDLADSFRVQEEIARKVSGQLLSSIRGMRVMPPAAMPAHISSS